MVSCSFPPLVNTWMAVSDCPDHRAWPQSPNTIWYVMPSTTQNATRVSLGICFSRFSNMLESFKSPCAKPLACIHTVACMVPRKTLCISRSTASAFCDSRPTMNRSLNFFRIKLPSTSKCCIASAPISCPFALRRATGQVPHPISFSSVGQKMPMPWQPCFLVA